MIEEDEGGASWEIKGNVLVLREESSNKEVVCGLLMRIWICFRRWTDAWEIPTT